MVVRLLHEADDQQHVAGVAAQRGQPRIGRRAWPPPAPGPTAGSRSAPAPGRRPAARPRPRRGAHIPPPARSWRPPRRDAARPARGRCGIPRPSAYLMVGSSVSQIEDAGVCAGSRRCRAAPGPPREPPSARWSPRRPCRPAPGGAPWRPAPPRNGRPRCGRAAARAAPAAPSRSAPGSAARGAASSGCGSGSRTAGWPVTGRRRPGSAAGAWSRSPDRGSARR